MNDATLSALLLEKLRKYRVAEPFGWMGVLAPRMSFSRAFVAAPSSASSLSPARRGSSGLSPARSSTGASTAAEVEMNLAHLGIPDSVGCAVFETVQAALLAGGNGGGGNMNSSSSMNMSSATSISPRRLKPASQVWDDSAVITASNRAASAASSPPSLFVTLRLSGNQLTGAVVPCVVALLSSTNKIRSLDLTENMLDAASITTLTNTVHSLAVRPNLFVDSASLAALKHQHQYQHYHHAPSADPLQDVSAISSGAGSNDSSTRHQQHQHPQSSSSQSVPPPNRRHSVTFSDDSLNGDLLGDAKVRKKEEKKKRQHQRSAGSKDGGDGASSSAAAVPHDKELLREFPRAFEPAPVVLVDLDLMKAQRDAQLAAEASRFAAAAAAAPPPHRPLEQQELVATAEVRHNQLPAQQRSLPDPHNESTQSFVELPLPLIRNNNNNANSSVSPPRAQVAVGKVASVRLAPRPDVQQQQQQPPAPVGKPASAPASRRSSSPQPLPQQQQQQREQVARALPTAAPAPAVVQSAAPAAPAPQQKQPPQQPRAASVSQPRAGSAPRQLSQPAAATTASSRGYADIAHEKAAAATAAVAPMTSTSSAATAPPPPPQPQPHLPDMVSVHDVMAAAAAAAASKENQQQQQQQQPRKTTTTATTVLHANNSFADVLDHLDISIGMPQDPISVVASDDDERNDVRGGGALAAGDGQQLPWLRARSLTMLSDAVRSGLFRNLTLLELRGLRLHELPPHLPPMLVRLDVSRNDLTTLRGVGDSCPHLEVVNARRNRIAAIGAQTFARCPALTHLFLGRNKIPFVEGLGHLRALHTLDLSFNAISQDLDIRPLAANDRSLRHLYLEGNPLHTRLTKPAAAGAATAPPTALARDAHSRYRVLVRGFCQCLVSLDNIMLPGAGRATVAATASATGGAGAPPPKRIRPEDLFDRDHAHYQQQQQQQKESRQVSPGRPQHAAPQAASVPRRDGSAAAVAAAAADEGEPRSWSASRGFSPGRRGATNVAAAAPMLATQQRMENRNGASYQQHAAEEPRSWSALRQHRASNAGSSAVTTPREAAVVSPPQQQHEEPRHHVRPSSAQRFPAADRNVGGGMRRPLSPQRAPPPVPSTTTSAAASAAYQQQQQQHNDLSFASTNSSSTSFLDAYDDDHLPTEILRFKEQLSNDLDAASVALRTYILVLGTMSPSSQEGKRCIGVVKRSGLLLDSVLRPSIVHFFNWTEDDLNVPPNSAEDTSIVDSVESGDLSGVSRYGAQLRARLLKQIHRLNDAKTCLRYITSLAEAGPGQEELLRVFVRRVGSTMK